MTQKAQNDSKDQIKNSDRTVTEYRVKFKSFN